MIPKVPMQAENLEPGKLYIWNLPHGERKVVWLNEDANGLAEYDPFHEEDHWFFSDGLVGDLYGPFELSA